MQTAILTVSWNLRYLIHIMKNVELILLEIAWFQN